ncbi:hypothetical protein [Dactylosporangium fulvum]|uniref:Uncharacterized protein n=1 Tax=Dactylosporangium fulvum TaxID=53359 RepID=A0ABY5W7Q1_9ACTN|nr:hypothetical protein [Dactylosporangium fulvum]UWP86108.1 hypothetical protein Dfulv_18430 [Dactylosporangium fulvum]
MSHPAGPPAWMRLLRCIGYGVLEGLTQLGFFYVGWVAYPHQTFWRSKPPAGGVRHGEEDR